jgi:tRNA pseudouridine55 synthase
MDPLADGMLPICLGDATKMSAFLLDSDKRYDFRLRLGVTTTTGDSEGEVVSERPVGAFGRDQIERVVAGFEGEIEQLPPMYSALKHQGKRLYELARQGVEVERQPRKVMIHELSLGEIALPEFQLQVHCSKGTYVRTLGEDIGEALGCGAHVVALRRTGVGPYTGQRMYRMDELEALAEDGLAALDAILLPLDTALGDWPQVEVGADAAFYMRQGQPVLVPKAPTSGWVRVYHGGSLLALAEIQDDGRVAPRRMMSG